MTKCNYCEEPATGFYELEPSLKKGRIKPIIINVCSEHENECGGRIITPHNVRPVEVKAKDLKKISKKPAPKAGCPHRWINYGSGRPEVCNICGKQRSAP